MARSGAAVTTEQEWLGNDAGDTGKGQAVQLEQLKGSGPALTIEQIATPEQIRAITEADLIRGMRLALRPFPSAHYSTAERPWAHTYPRAGVRRRPDGRWHLRIWLDATLPDPIQGGACETRVEAMDLGAMICQFARQAAA